MSSTRLSETRSRVGLVCADRLRRHFPQLEAAQLFALADHCADLEQRLRAMNVAEVRNILGSFTLEVHVSRDRVKASISG